MRPLPLPAVGVDAAARLTQWTLGARRASIYITLARHYHAHNVLDWVFIHVPMRLFLIVVFSIDWLDNGFIVMGWEMSPHPFSSFSMLVRP